MKKGLFLIVIFLTTLSKPYAQIVRIGFGTNLYGLSPKPFGVSTKSKFGIQMGGDVQLGKGHLYFQPGVQYNITNVGFDSYSISGLQGNVLLGGVKIPFLIGFRFVRVKMYTPKNFRFFMGPSFMAVTSINHRRSDDLAFKLTDKEYHDVEWAWHSGFGIDRKRFFVDAGFQKGLTYVFTGGSDSRSKMFYVNIGIKFEGKPKIRSIIDRFD